MKPSKFQFISAQGWAIAALALCMLLGALGISIVSIALPGLATTFGTDLTGAQWVVISYLLAVTVTTVPAGRLGDVLGTKPVLVTGLAVFLLASVACMLAPSLWFLVGARALQGIAAAALMTLTLAAVRETVSSDTVGSAMGLLGTTSAIGTALGPSLGGFLIDAFGWPSIFLTLALVAALALGLCTVLLPGNAGKRFPVHYQQDVAGLLALILLLGAYALALTLDPATPAWVRVGLLGCALVGLCAFIWIEKRAANPVLALSLLANRTLTQGAVMNALVSSVMMATLVVGPFYLTLGLGHSTLHAGLLMTVGPAMAALSGVPAGRLTDRLGAQTALRVGLAQLLLGTLTLAWLPILFGTPGFVVAFLLLTPGYQLFLAAVMTEVLNDAAADARGVSSGVMTLSRNLGFLTGASLMGTLFASALGAPIDTATPDTVGYGMTITYMVSSCLVLGALALSFVRRRQR